MSSHRKLVYPEDFQNTILNLVIHSTKFLKAVRSRLAASHFDSKEQWVLCQLAYQFYDRYKQAPGLLLSQELAKYTCRAGIKPDDAALARRLLSRQIRKVDCSLEYVVNEIEQFLQHEEIRNTLESFLPQYNQGDLRRRRAAAQTE